MQNRLAKRFEHANNYILYNTETKNFEAFENEEEGHHYENHPYFLDKDVEAFIVGNVGTYAFEIINMPKSKVYLARKMSVYESVKKLLNNELQ